VGVARELRVGFLRFFLLIARTLFCNATIYEGSKLAVDPRTGYENTNNFFIIAELEVVLDNHVLISRIG
jgi:hypothetical protein